MAEWLFDPNGIPRIIVDGNCFRSAHGRVIGWGHSQSAYSLGGSHLGWYEDGVLYDRKNRTVGFCYGATGHVPSRPPLTGTPDMPGFAAAPVLPSLAGAPGRPGYGGWSEMDLENFF